MPVPTRRPTGTKPWGVLGYLKDLISPPGYVARGPFGSRAASAATQPAQAPTDAQLRAQGYGFGVHENDPYGRRTSGRAPTDAELQAEGYGFGVREYDPLETKRRQVQPATPTRLGGGALVAAPIITSAGVVQPGAIVTGLTPTGAVDYTQGDEYKSQMAQYQNLIKEQKQQEAEDLGMKIWMEKYGKTPMAQTGGAVGAYNPLLASMFPETKGYSGTFAPVEEIQMGDLGTRAQGEGGPTMESLGLLDKQAAQQDATAAQADMATTAGMSAGERARNLTRAFRLGMI